MPLCDQKGAIGAGGQNFFVNMPMITNQLIWHCKLCVGNFPVCVCPLSVGYCRGSRVEGKISRVEGQF